MIFNQSEQLNKKTISTRWFFLCCAFVFFAQSVWAQEHAAPELVIGDWVFRQGTSLESYLIASVVQSEFSHIGMVVQTVPEVLILHSTTDDLQDEANQVMLSSWSQFTDARLATRVAVARPEFLTREQRIRISQALMAQLGLPFVLASRAEPHAYCTTVLADAIQREDPSFSPVWTQVQQPMLRGEYLHPQAFADMPRLNWVVP